MHPLLQHLPRAPGSLVAALLLSSLPAISQAIPVSTTPLIFQTSGQNMWGPGSSYRFDKTLDLGTSWNTGTARIGGITGSVSTFDGIPYYEDHGYWDSHKVHCHSVLCAGIDPHPSLPEFHSNGEWHTPKITLDTRTGAEASASTSGSVGIKLGAKIDSGSVDAKVSYSATLDLPDPVNPGDYFSLNAGQALAGDQQLNTRLSSASGKIQAYLGAKAKLAGKGCFLTLGCTSGSTTVGFNEQTLDIISFNDPSSPGEIKILGALDPAAFQFGQPIDLPPDPYFDYGSVTVYVPDLKATGTRSGDRIVASGASDLLDLKLDLDGILFNSLGLPALLGTSLNAGPLAVSYDIIDVNAGLDFDIEQRFALDPTLMVELNFDHPVLMDGFISEITRWTGIWDEIPDIALHDRHDVNATPTFFLDAMFANATTIGVDGIFEVDVLAASFAIEAFGLSLDVGSLGPLYSFAAGVDLFTFPDLFNSNFALGGFNTVAGNSFALRSIAPVPEPGSLLLLALGLALLWRRRPPQGYARHPF